MNTEINDDAIVGAAIPKRDAPIDWTVLLFLSLTPVIGTVGTAVYTWMNGFEWWMPILAVVMYLLVGMSICAGYHRFFSHKSYESSRVVQVFYAIFGAMAAQNSALTWSASHRIHHKYVDEDWDPYNIRRGFWYAHILWVFRKNPTPDPEMYAPDLLKNPVVMWQHRWYKFLLIVVGFGLPALIGAAFGDWIAGLLWGGFLRIAVIHHTTFFVNSLAHFVGKPSYNAQVSAKDNWAVALLTLGEGYHSFHHRFPADFRNGIRWYHWDPAKWFIAALRSVGLASRLKSTPPPQIEQARLQAELAAMEDRLTVAEPGLAQQVQTHIEAARMHLTEALTLWRQYAKERSEGLSSAWRDTRRQAREHVRQSRRQWKNASRMLRQAPATVSISGHTR